MKRPTGSFSGLVIAAIGFQLLICSAASAASACSGTFDRIPASVAHAIREISDRHAIHEQSICRLPAGFTIADCQSSITPVVPTQSTNPSLKYLSIATLDLPPPMQG